MQFATFIVMSSSPLRLSDLYGCRTSYNRRLKISERAHRESAPRSAKRERKGPETNRMKTRRVEAVAAKPLCSLCPAHLISQSLLHTAMWPSTATITGTTHMHHVQKQNRQPAATGKMRQNKRDGIQTNKQNKGDVEHRQQKLQFPKCLQPKSTEAPPKGRGLPCSHADHARLMCRTVQLPKPNERETLA